MLAGHCGAPFTSAVGRKPALVNGSLLEAQCNASQPSFVNFEAAALPAGHERPVAGSPAYRLSAGIRDLRVCRESGLTF
jgi:hypothetical protein